MTTPSGQIKFSNIISEFGPSFADPTNGLPNRSKLGSYRVSQSVAGRNWPLDDGVPTSGPIKFSDLRNKTLNVVVDYSGETEYGVDSTNKYNNGVVIGYKSRPSIDSADSKKVQNVIRKTIGAATGVALKTGSGWGSNTILKYYIANGGKVFGSGGKGGEGAGTNGTTVGTCGLEAGFPGGHAFGVSYNCSITVESGGILAGGGGGGGGGGFTYSGGSGDGRFMGGGGGGGAGLPAGGGGPRGNKCVDGGRNNNYGVAGSAGSLYSGGAGGSGSNWGDGGVARKGGNGGDLGLDGKHGNPLSGGGRTPDSGFSSAGAPGGTAGAAVIRNSSELTAVITKQGGTVSGSETKVGSFL